ncbi:MAG: glycogen synthase GlgA [Pseudomonadota bacterium]
MRILFATSEAWPLLKTGGLADVAYGLPRALREEGVDIRLVLPAHPDAVARLEGPVQRQEATLDGRPLTLIEGSLPGTGVPVWLVDDPPLFARAGNPYTTEDGVPWPDNARRYHRFSRVAAALAAGELTDWRADLLHANDWQTALAPLFLRAWPDRPASLFTIHNLAYRGLFPASTLGQLGLDPGLWGPEGLEFFGELAFIKGGLNFADALTTVSPTYAREIQTTHFGCGLDGVLRARAANLHGIVNGIDTGTWDPATDPHLAARYAEPDEAARTANRTELARRMGLTDGRGPVIGFIGRLVEQKGIDLLLPALSRLVEQGARFALLGAGEPHLEAGLRAAAERHPGAVGVHIGYDEALAHLVEAGSDLFLMPSRFEPCGLNQLYSLRYGTPPIVNPTGGLADTVVDVGVDPKAGTGFHIPHLDAAALAATVERALLHWEEGRDWRALQARGMAGDYSWNRSAAQYVSLYQALARA